MKRKAKYSKYSKTLFLCICAIITCIAVGLFLSFYKAGTMFYDGILLMRKVSFDNISFGATFTNAVNSDLYFCLSILLFSGGFPTVFVSPILFSFKLLSVGITVGLAARCCAFGKAMGVFLSVFFSNILSIPLYAVLIFVSLNFFDGIRQRHFYSNNMLKNYFFFMTKVFVIFVFMCIAQLIQCGLGILALKVAVV